MQFQDDGWLWMGFCQFKGMLLRTSKGTRKVLREGALSQKVRLVSLKSYTFFFSLEVSASFELFNSISVGQVDEVKKIHKWATRLHVC